MVEQNQSVRLSGMLLFFLPLGFSALLISLSHVIINSTLAHAATRPELVITGYAMAFSIFGLTEEAAVLMRQTCTALVRDRRTFRALLLLAFFLITFILLISFTVAYTPVGAYLFSYVFGVDVELQKDILSTYRILLFVTIFSVIRCIYQGILISHMRTKWLTIAMVVRLSVMYGLSLLYIHNPQAIDGRSGAFIFLAGMMIEAAVSYGEGRLLVKKLPLHSTEGESRDLRGVFTFYRPMLISVFFAVSVTPAINVLLGQTSNMELAVASYSLAFSITWLAISFQTYMHQIVLNFFNKSSRLVYRFCLIVGLIPVCALILLGFTPAGQWALQNLVGVNGELLDATHEALRIFALFALVFPWVDFCNGIVLLRGQTSIMVWSQGSNITITVIVLLLGVWLTPGWNGVIGALAQSAGILAELSVLVAWLSRLRQPTPLYSSAAAKEIS
ncbi:multi antimicrobial extrusion protein MatE [Paenibacillus sp. GD4]|uniref:multi antimicrobial extrusion protein MatE n=1 Tax=Paenibacillus sp. GD4 TaxID=3068890 RepID=UPI0027965AC2|nr:multi antimicrobial extrusion protein MatE [Paenibacillus sp. GD4]MDQ1914260.1 multi antimicrobial extrusion protein MatE [Paenibacillus sp. GD4]